MDANRNGKVEEDERKAALEAWKAQRMQQRKAETEAKAAVRKADENVKRQQQKVSATLLEKYDRNKNGRMDPNEWERRRKDMEEIRKQRQPR